MRLPLRLAYQLRRFWWFLARPLTVGVRLILESEGQVLLVKHSYRHSWYLPGGGVRRGESLKDAARREAAEEVGANVGRLRLLGVYSNFAEYKSDHIVVFSSADFRLGVSQSPEIASRRYFPLDDLPADVSPGTHRRLAEYVRGESPPTSGAW